MPAAPGPHGGPPPPRERRALSALRCPPGAPPGGRAHIQVLPGAPGGTLNLLVGTSGWQYASWRGRLYPEGLVQRRELAFYAERFRTVEVNNTFYRLPERRTFQSWAEQTPDDFVFALKASRFLTHVKRLKDPRDPVELFLDRAGPLGQKLGPVLLQMPPTARRDDERLAAALAAFPGGVRVAFEPRHESWFAEPVRRLLEERDAALVLADRGSRWVTPQWRTAGWAYARFHAGAGSPPGCYGRTALESRVESMARLWPKRAEGYVYFNNDGHGCAPRDARWFALASAKAGAKVARTPEAGETPVGGMERRGGTGSLW